LIKGGFDHLVEIFLNTSAYEGTEEKKIAKSKKDSQKKLDGELINN